MQTKSSHRHLLILFITPMSMDIDFTLYGDIQTALRFFSAIPFFLVSVIVISLLFSFSISGLSSLP